MKSFHSLFVALLLAVPVFAGTNLNDVQSQLNPTSVEALLSPRTVGEVQGAIRLAEQEDLAISISGGRHSMGGQQFGSGNLQIDMSRMTRVVSFDRTNGLVTVEAGITWPTLVNWLLDNQKNDAQPWGIRQKQTGANRMTIGGSVSANSHGHGLNMLPIIDDVEAFRIVDASATVITCSRTQNPELFRLGIGGFGMFGVIVEVTLRLSPRTKLERVVELVDVSGLKDRFEECGRSGFLYGDFRFAIDPSSPDFLRKGLFSAFRRAPADTKMPSRSREFSEKEWADHEFLLHTDKKKAWAKYLSFYQATNGQKYWSDTHHLTAYVDDYHAAISTRMKAKEKATEMLGEVYVPRERYVAFVEEVRGWALEKKPEIISATVRVIEKDEGTFLSWARENWMCTTVSLHVVHTEAGLWKAQNDFRELTDLALKHGGSYSLSYHRWATREQVERAHPRMVDFLREKRKYDPDRRFRSEWYRHFAAMFSAQLTTERAK